VVMLGPTIVSLTGAQTGTVLIQWTSVTNVTYRVQCRTNLTDASWVDLTPDVTATNSISSLGDNSSANAQRFYRVMVVH
jgi:hypothetical protein